jgi:hypothetical protein
VVWHNTYENGDRMVYARRLDKNGVPIGSPFQLSNVSVDQVHPNVVYNPVDDVYFVVWMYDASGNNTRYEIYGSIIPWNAVNPGTIFSIYGNASYTLWKPTVAWNDYMTNEYLVLFDSYLVSNPTVADRIHIRQVHSNGTLGIEKALGLANSTESDMDFNYVWAAGFLIVYARTGSEKGIWGIWLHPDLTQTQLDFQIFSGPAHNPVVATQHYNHYVVAWEYSSTYNYVYVSCMDLFDHYAY